MWWHGDAGLTERSALLFVWEVVLREVVLNVGKYSVAAKNHVQWPEKVVRPVGRLTINRNVIRQTLPSSKSERRTELPLTCINIVAWLGLHKDEVSTQIQDQSTESADCCAFRPVHKVYSA